MKFYQVLSITLIAVALTACGPSKKPLSAEAKKSLHTVSIKSDVDMPNKMFFHGKTQSIAGNFGLLGMMIGEAMQRKNVSVEGIVREAFRNEMAKRTPYKPLKSGAKSDANLFIEVDSYGFAAAGISSKFSPHLVVYAEMKDRNGKTIWRNKGRVNTLTKNNKAQYTYKQMIGLLRQFLRQPNIEIQIYAIRMSMVSSFSEIEQVKVLINQTTHCLAINLNWCDPVYRRSNKVEIH